MSVNSVTSFQPYNFKLARESSQNCELPSLKTSSNVQPYSLKLALEAQKADKKEDELSLGELVAGAKIDDNGTLRVSTMNKGWLDSNVWYIINPDGSGQVQTVWTKPDADDNKIEKGKLSEIYSKAIELSENNNGTISDEAAVSLAQDIVKTLR